MSKPISIHSIENQQIVSPDLIRQRAVKLSNPSAGDIQSNRTRLRPVSIKELEQRPLGFVALDGATQAGFVWVQAPVADTILAEISTLLVEMAYRGQGIATMLIQAATAATLQAGWQPFALAAHPAAQKALLKAGYCQVAMSSVPADPHNDSAAAYLFYPGTEPSLA